MKELYSLFTVLILSFNSILAQQTPFFDVKGKEIIGPDGQSFLMKGINLGNWLVPEGYMFNFKHASSPRAIEEVVSQLIGPSASAAFWGNYLNEYISAPDIRFIKSTGANSIRIPFHYKLFTNESYLGSADSTRGFKLLDKLLSWCRKEKLYVILDMHCAPGGQTGDNIDDSYGYPFLFESLESQRLCVAIWKRIAKYYRDEPLIIGYDLLNEPIAHYFDKERLNPYLDPLYKKIVSAIRSSDPRHLVFLGGAQWNSNFKVFSEPFDNKVVYSFHKYWTGTSQDVIQEYLDFQKHYNIPLYLGESGENTDEWVDAFVHLLKRHNIGWHFWPYKKMDSSSCMASFAAPEGYQDIIAFANADRTGFDDLRAARKPFNQHTALSVLERLLNNCRFENVRVNPGYIRALNLK